MKFFISTSSCFLVFSHVHSTPPITEKKYAEILLRYRQLFVKGEVFISEWGIFSAEVFLRYSRFFVKGNFIIGEVECIVHGIDCLAGECCSWLHLT